VLVVSQVRVLLAGLPDVLADIVEASLDRAEIEIVGRVSDRRWLGGAVRDARPDVVIWGASGSGGCPSWHELLATTPRLVVVALTDGARRAVTCELTAWTGGEQIGPERLAELVLEAGAKA
jgi:AmiR/NasT family two-component response regulator